MYKYERIIIKPNASYRFSYVAIIKFIIFIIIRERGIYNQK